MSDDSFDWRPSARRLRSGWPTIAIAAAVGALVGLLLALVDGNRYESAAMLAVTKPELVARFDDRLAPAQQNPSFPYQVATLRAYAELARSDAVLRSVAASIGMEEERSAELSPRLRVKALADGSLLVLSGRGASAAEAAELANAWADALVARSADVFSGRLADAALLRERDEARDDLAEAEARLQAFHADSRLPARELELEARQRRYRELLGAQDRVRSVERDLATLRDQLAAGDPDLGDRLAALAVQMGSLTAGTGLPVQIDVAASGVDAGVAAADLQALEDAAATLASTLAEEMSGMPDELDGLTVEVETLRATRAALERDRRIAEERLVAVSHKVDERGVTRAVSGTELQVAAAAVEPPSADWTPIARDAGMGGLFGALAGAAVVLAAGSRGARRPGGPGDVA